MCCVNRDFTSVGVDDTRRNEPIFIKFEMKFPFPLQSDVIQLCIKNLNDNNIIENRQ